MKKRTPVPAYMLLLSLSNKLKFFSSHSITPCICQSLAKIIRRKFANTYWESQYIQPYKKFQDKFRFVAWSADFLTRLFMNIF